MSKKPAVDVGTFDPIGKNFSDGSEVALVGTLVNDGTTYTLGASVLVGAADTPGACVIGKRLETVGGAEITLGKLLDL